MQMKWMAVWSVVGFLLIGPAGDVAWAQSPPLDYFSVTPCRLLDTRVPVQGPALASGASRLVTVTGGSCGVPASARAIAANITAVAPTGVGNLRLYPGDGTVPPTSALNFGAGQTRANNGVFALANNGNGTLAIFASVAGAGTVHAVLDVTGYFAPACTDLPAANVGCEFYAVPLANTLLFKGFNFAVGLANTTSQTASVTISGGALSSPQTYTVPPAAYAMIPLPWVIGLQTTGATVLSKGGAYRIVSDRPLSAYQFNPLAFTDGGNYSYTNDASLLLPVHALGGNYRVAAWPSWSTQPGYFAVVATANQTTVSISPTASILAGGGLSALGGSVTLDRGDVLQVLAPTPGGLTYSNDLSGSVVTASNPVAVFGGHDATWIPATFGYADHLEEQLPPAETLGTEHVVAVPANPLAPSKHYVKLVGTQDGTSLAFMPAVAGIPSVLNAGQTVTFEATQDFRMVSSHPVIVAQYLEGQDRVVAGDPAMGIVVPSAQFRAQYVFIAPSAFTQNWVTIVAPVGQAVRLDGAVVDPVSFTTITGTPWAVARVFLSGTTGVHRVSASVPVGAYVYGYAQYTSYMYPAGMDLKR